MRASRSHLNSFRTAILHQAGPVEAVGGVIKPMKPGGYSDSAADLAYNLRARGEQIVTPVPTPDPTIDKDWSFPDSVEGVTHALKLGANVLWANTTLTSKHAIVQLRSELARANVRMVGQSPFDTEKYEDKEWTNTWLAGHDELKGCFPTSRRVTAADELDSVTLPAMCKPIRGRGSHGVTLAKTGEELEVTVKQLLSESDAILVESYLAGEEITITVMPPGEYATAWRGSYWSLPVVTRFNHQNGVVPYNGIVAVTANSRALSKAEHDADPSYALAQKQCEKVAELCRATAPIRVDCRRAVDGAVFTLFDVNMKPNATGPGRPGRDQQASLVTMAAAEIGWDYSDLIVNILAQARLVSEVLR